MEQLGVAIPWLLRYQRRMLDGVALTVETTGSDEHRVTGDPEGLERLRAARLGI